MLLLFPEPLYRRTIAPLLDVVLTIAYNEY
jgi:hypothetical protein